VRCRETARLELHHEWPYALGGPCTEDNLALRCTAHNALAAEQDFGREHMAAMRQRGAGRCRDVSVERAEEPSPRRRGGQRADDRSEGSWDDGDDSDWVVERPSERELAEQQLRFASVTGLFVGPRG
jgi:hypothetical protein